ncbi:MAG: hypothetical protein E6772_10300 [Dysgonomonas sp.]|nr:hypothetical protein [Dysgonomonas sp.]
MSNYRVINRDIAGQLTPSETYTYFSLLSKSDFNTGKSHIKQINLCELAEIKKPDTIQKHLKKFSELSLLKVERALRDGNKGIFRTNTYHLYIPTQNWVRVKLNLIDKDICPKIRGFLILLKCLALNNSNFIGSNKSQISKKLHLDPKTIRKHLKECISLGLVKELDNGFIISDNSFPIDIDLSKYESFYAENYKIICDFCNENGLLVPNFNKKVMLEIVVKYRDEFLLERLNSHCKVLSPNHFYDLKYFAKVLGVKIKEKVKSNIEPIIMD